LNALGRLLAVGSEWGGYATLVPTGGARKAARAAADEASEQLGRQGARQAARGASQQAAQLRPALMPPAQWGAGYYRHGGLMTTVEHIMYRHAWENSWSQPVSRFLRGTTARDIVGYVEQALSQGQWSAKGLERYQVRFRFGRPIGVDIHGNLTDTIEVWVQSGIIRTAYPVAP
jgi:hypothetical protein